MTWASSYSILVRCMTEFSDSTLGHVLLPHAVSPKTKVQMTVDWQLENWDKKVDYLWCLSQWQTAHRKRPYSMRGLQVQILLKNTYIPDGPSWLYLSQDKHLWASEQKDCTSLCHIKPCKSLYLREFFKNLICICSLIQREGHREQA